jgi:DNA modification methylase
MISKKENEVFRFKNSKMSLSFGDWDYDFDLTKHLDLILPHIKNSGSIVVFHGDDQTNEVVGSFKEHKIDKKRKLVFKKTNPYPLHLERKYISDVEFATWGVKSGNWTFNRQHTPFDSCIIDFPNTERSTHPTPKPYKVIEELVLRHTNAGDLVLDPFGGSGTTALACKRNGRYYIMIEREQEYCDLIVKRVELGRVKLQFHGDALTIREKIGGNQ